MPIKDSIIKDTTNYYTEMLNRFGPTFQGVDWNSKESQELRFDQLIKVINMPHGNFSILDYGCGAGILDCLPDKLDCLFNILFIS